MATKKKPAKKKPTKKTPRGTKKAAGRGGT